MSYGRNAGFRNDGKPFCAGCKRTVTPARQKWCFDQPGAFGGKVYCDSCAENRRSERKAHDQVESPTVNPPAPTQTRQAAQTNYQVTSEPWWRGVVDWADDVASDVLVSSDFWRLVAGVLWLMCLATVVSLVSPQAGWSDGFMATLLGVVATVATWYSNELKRMYRGV